MLDGKVTKGKGPIINLVWMTLDQVDAVQTRMPVCKASKPGRYFTGRPLLGGASFFVSCP